MNGNDVLERIIYSVVMVSLERNTATKDQQNDNSYTNTL